MIQKLINQSHKLDSLLFTLHERTVTQHGKWDREMIEPLIHDAMVLLDEHRKQIQEIRNTLAIVNG